MTLPWPPPDRTHALERLAQLDAEVYGRTRNHLDGAVSGLSPCLTHGMLTLREALYEVHRRQPLPLRHPWVQELGWRAHGRHVWAHGGEAALLGPEGPEGPHAMATDPAHPAPPMPDDIAQGRTGIPAIDQAVRQLHATGHLHNHARLWLASYCVHLRGVPWRTGADWLLAHLLDGDLASNHLAWQWVAGGGGRKPYVFNADNVATFAPEPWHSPGTALDTDYPTLQAIALGQRPRPVADTPHVDGPHGLAQPDLHAQPPRGLLPPAPDLGSLAGRDVWLVHPWALRPAPNLAPGQSAANRVCLGVYLSEWHTRWPWTARRWAYVDSAMATLSAQRWHGPASALRQALAGARSVSAHAEPHAAPCLQDWVALQPPPRVFPEVDRLHRSFSGWWRACTRGLHTTDDLLAATA